MVNLIYKIVLTYSDKKIEFYNKKDGYVLNVKKWVIVKNNKRFIM